MNVFSLIWQGVWTGIGVELSLFTLWVGWKLMHLRYVRKLESNHWLHKIVGEYFE
jgi:hypothetical protein